MTTSIQEAQWVLRAQCDDREALELLLRSAQDSLHRYACSLVGPSAANDVLQDVLIIIFRKLKWLSKPELFRPWSYRITSRAAFRHLRKQRRWPDQLPEDFVLEEIPAPDERPSDELLQTVLNTDDISPASRAVLALHFQEELSLQEVAAILEIPLGTVKSRLAYGLAALRKQHINTRRV
jgi:RNA polymerase sigma-70 factor (ECF subfamily)